MNYDEARRRYEHDPEFHTLVDTIFAMAFNLQYTAGEVRDAATFAMLKVESLSVRHHYPSAPAAPEGNTP